MYYRNEIYSLGHHPDLSFLRAVSEVVVSGAQESPDSRCLDLPESQVKMSSSIV